MCKSRKDLCVYGSGVACQICKERKVRCSFLEWRRKRKNEEVDSEEDEGEPTPKKLRNGGSKPSGSKPSVEITSSALGANKSPVTEMVGLLQELVEGVRDLTKVTRGVAGLGVQIHQQNAKLIRLGERQSYLAEKALAKGLGLGSEEGSGLKKDKGKGKAEVTEDKEEMMRSNGDSGSDEEEEDEARLNEDVGGSVTGSDKEL
jgi:hypothetical protein